MQIADRIRKAIERDGRTQREIAKAAKIHEVNLAQFKLGNRELPLETLCRVAKVVGLEITVQDKKRN